MARVACIVWQKDETVLLRPWLQYHAALLGQNNIYVFDNGSAEPDVTKLLYESSFFGLNVDLSPASPQDRQRRGEWVGNLIARFRDTDAYDVVVVLEPTDFLAAKGLNGFTCNQNEIMAEFEAVHQRGHFHMTQGALANLPGWLNLFVYGTINRCVIPVAKFAGISNDLAGATLPEGEFYHSTRLSVISLLHQPLGVVQQNAARALRELEANPDLTVPAKLVENLQEAVALEAEAYYALPDTRQRALVRYSGLAKALSGVVDLRALLAQWEAGRAELGVVAPIVIDLDRLVFTPVGYLATHRDLVDAKIDPYDHFFNHGFLESRKIDNSAAGRVEALQRLESFRNHDVDTPQNYSGVAHDFAAAGRLEDAPALLERAIAHFGELTILLFELAVSYELARDWPQAVAAWRRLAEKDRGNELAWLRYALALAKIEDIAAALDVCCTCAERFPANRSFCEHGILFAERLGNWKLAETLRRVLSAPVPAAVVAPQAAGKPAVRRRARRQTAVAGASPYGNLPARSFWRSGVVERHPLAIGDVYLKKFALAPDEKIATAGSCFAQNIAAYLRANGFGVIDAEPAPQGMSGETAQRFGFSQYAARYGNIYTTRQLLQLVLEATGRRSPREVVWENNGRFYDALRPAVEPEGLDSAPQVLEHRQQHLARVADVLHTASLFVFTLGLTETWELIDDGTVYPTAPGTIAGNFDATRYRFKNLTFQEVYDDFLRVREILKLINPGMRFIVTVSPVPLTATASRDHVLAASSYSKSVLRAVAGQLAAEYDDVDYFPAYEIISGIQARSMFYEGNLRGIAKAGVNVVMQAFFEQHGGGAEVAQADVAVAPADSKVFCEELLLEAFAP